MAATPPSPPNPPAGWLSAHVQGPIAVLGPGTGLGEAVLFWDDNPSSPSSGYRVYPSEGSHAGFAPRGWRQRALLVRAHCLSGIVCVVQRSWVRPGWLCCKGLGGQQALLVCAAAAHAAVSVSWRMCIRSPACSMGHGTQVMEAGATTHPLAQPACCHHSLAAAMQAFVEQELGRCGVEQVRTRSAGSALHVCPRSHWCPAVRPQQGSSMS